jgi:HK97 family phage major capsid protein
MTTKVEELTERLKSVLLAASDIAGTAEKEDRDFTDDERAAVKAKIDEAKDIKAQLVKVKADGKVRAALAELGDGVDLVDSPAKQAPGLYLPTGRKSIGEHFAGSAEYKALMQSVPNGRFSDKHRVQSQSVGFQKLLAPHGQKALLTGLSDTAAGALVTNDALGLQVGMDAFQRPLTIRDLVTNGTTTSDTVEYVRITAATNAAVPVAEATTTANGTKPESSMALAKVTTTVKTIAHWIPVTKRALSDAAQIRTLIDNFLMYGLEEELEDQMIAGDATGENFDGLGNVSGTQSQAWDTNILTTLRKAKTKVRTVGRSVPTGWAMNPADVEALDLLTDNENRFYFGGPGGTIGGSAPLWNLPIVESEAVPAGTAYVGDWRKAILWDREEATITVSDSHENYFIKNLVAILAESRHAFGVIQPNAFVEIDLTA